MIFKLKTESFLTQNKMKLLQTLWLMSLGLFSHEAQVTENKTEIKIKA